MASRKRIQCLDRAMDILERIAQVGQVGVTELAGLMSLHVATTYNIVNTLVLRGYLQNDQGRYRLGPAAAALAGRWDPAVSLPGLAGPYLEEISRRTGEASVLTVMVGMRVQVVSHVPGSADVTAQFPRHTCEFPMQMATGRLLVALGPEELWEKTISRHKPGGWVHGPEKGWREKDWYRELCKIRAKEAVMIRRPGAEGLCAVAAPVRGRGGVLLAAVGASCPNCRSTSAHRREMLQAVGEAAGSLSHALGYEDDASAK